MIVRASSGLAASVERHLEVVVVAAVSNEGCFDSTTGVRTQSERDKVSIRLLVGIRVKGYCLNVCPERAERQPPFTRGIDDEIAVNGIVVVGIGLLAHHALIGP